MKGQEAKGEREERVCSHGSRGNEGVLMTYMLRYLRNWPKVESDH